MKYLTMALLFLATSTLANMQSIDRFLIDKTEVTVGQLRKLIEAKGYVKQQKNVLVGLSTARDGSKKLAGSGQHLMALSQSRMNQQYM